MTTLPITDIEPGCYVDRSHGPLQLGMVCDLAINSGWEPDGTYASIREVHDAEVRAAYETRSPQRLPDPTVLLSYVDEAEAWLNDHTDGAGTWQWFEGDFGYYVDEDDA